MTTFSPRRLALRLAIYYGILVVSLLVALNLWPEAFQYLPFGGRDALQGAPIESATEFLKSVEQTRPRAGPAVDEMAAIGTITLFVVGHLTGTLLLMLPIAWTYSAINHEAGFRKTFVRSLIVLPLCATTVVLLIQDSLALAFGLAALVAAVRFRVALDEAMDGIFIFAAICVGLAAGIGYLGVALVMSLFFCFASVVMWAVDYGRNPIDESRLARKRAKHEKAGKPADL